LNSPDAILISLAGDAQEEAPIMSTQHGGNGQTALVTGASSGIGLELARQFAAGGYDLVLVARSTGALERLAADLGREFGVKTTAVTCDLGQPNAGRELVRTLDRRSLAIDVLVNNAGFGATGAFAGGETDVQVGIVDVNVRALVELTHELWPRILRKGRGGVLNVASTAAFQPGPFMSVYCASKAFVLSFTEALWEEARGSGVRVSCLCPGYTESAFHQRAGTDKVRLARGSAMSAAQAAELGYRAFEANRRVKIAGLANALLARSAAVTPHALVLRIARFLLTRAEPA
jgi:short-subunit dehydrogenase